MAIETFGDLVLAMIFSSLYMAFAIYFIWFILPAWLAIKDR